MSINVKHYLVLKQPVSKINCNITVTKRFTHPTMWHPQLMSALLLRMPHGIMGETFGEYNDRMTQLIPGDLDYKTQIMSYLIL